MNPTQYLKKKKPLDTESLLAILLLALIVIVLIVSIVLAVSVLVNRDDPQDDGSNPNNPTSRAIFSNGVVPIMPTADENTATVDHLYSDYGIIIDATNGKILASASSDTPFSPASMAKVMTLIVACEKLTEADLAKQIDYTEYYKNYDYNGLQVAFKYAIPLNTATLPGGTASPCRVVIKDILYGIGVLSAGDCSLMIAEYTYGSLDAFVAAMNQKALDLGLTQTRFADAAGDDLPGNVTTAKEMAVIMAYAMQCPLICEILAEDAHSYCPKYTDVNGNEQDYDQFTFYSTLFDLNSKKAQTRMEKYREMYGKRFKLETAENFIGKTGYLTPPDRSYLVCGASGKTTGNNYVVVVGDTNKFAYTMKDVKDLFDAYAK